MRIRHLALVPIAALVASSAVGCIAIVPAFDAEDHCRIQGSSDCASCIREQCQAEIDTCCGSKSCNGLDPVFGDYQTTLPELDECGKGNAATCAEKFQKAKPETEAEAVRGCVTAKCNDACLSGSGTSVEAPEWTCETPRESDTSCAKCIYSKCEDDLDDCCKDASCGDGSSTIRDDMGRCIAGDKRGCAWLLTESSSGREGVVRGCIAKNCAETCMGDPPLTHTTCSLYGAGSFCTCRDSETAGTQECSVDEVGGTCVISVAGCQCGTYGCSGTSTGCSCDFREGGGTTSCEAPPSSGSTSGKTCCLVFDRSSVRCRCDSYSCLDTIGEYEIDSCNEATVIARLGERIVDSCSR